MNLNFTRLLPRSIRHSLIRRNYRIDDASLADVEVKIATTVAEHVEAAKLVHDGYVGRGIMMPHGSGVRVTPFLALPSTIVFVALKSGQMVGTLSLVVDSSLGLPMEKIYGDEVQAVRSRSRKIAEVGAQCVVKECRGTGVAFLLSKAMFQTTELLGIEDLLIAVHPSAEDVYSAMLCFERLGPQKAYPLLNQSALAVAMWQRGGYRKALGQAFGRLPSTASNPHFLYCERPEPQIHLPSDSSFLAPLAKVHRQAAMKLAALRPDMVTDLAAVDFEKIRAEMSAPAARSAGPSTPDVICPVAGCHGAPLPAA